MALVGAAWSKRKDGDHSHVKAIYLTAIETHEVLSNPSSSNDNLDIHKLQKKNEELIKHNEHILRNIEKHAMDQHKLKEEIGKLERKLILLKFKKSENDLNKMLSEQKTLS